MSYKIDCPFCSQRLEVPPELDDTSTNCPACGQEIYLSRADAVEDLDPATAALRREFLESEKRHQEQLRMIMTMQSSQNQSKQVIAVLLWLFVYIPLIALGIWIMVIVALSVIG